MTSVHQDREITGSPESPRSAIVTGAANGIGRATATLLNQRGVQVLAVDREAGLLTALADELAATGTAVHAFVADVSRSEDVRGYVSAARDAFGSIDFFFNNAGIIGKLLPIVELEETTFDSVLAVNVRGAFLGLKYVLPSMYEQGRGAVVNTASVAGLVGHIDHGAYVASKHALVGLTKVAGAEAAQHGVRVNAIAPGPTRTAMIESVEQMKSPDQADAERQRLLGNIPAHRYGTTTEVAQAVYFLLSDESAYLNGSVLTIDGAFTAIR